MCASDNEHGHDHAIAAAVPDAAAANGAAASAALVADLVSANRILFDQNVLDAFGHVSVRHDSRPDCYLLARNMAPGLVTADDIITFDLDSQPLNAAGRGVYLERFIHGEIYRARPDVMAVVHSHSASMVPFGVVEGATLRPICHMSGFLGAGAPIFEIREAAGDGTDMLVRNPALGVALARSLGDAYAVLMRGHGSTVVANTLRAAVYRAVYAEVNAKLQMQAQAMGRVNFLTPAEARTAMTNIETQIERPWNLWRQRAGG